MKRIVSCCSPTLTLVSFTRSLTEGFSMVAMIPLNDGHTIPQLGLGVWQMKDQEAYDAVSYALSIGYRHIDTAALYHNEEAVGRAIADSGLDRDEIFVTTKLWNDRHDDAPAALTESLSKLGLEFVDLYLIHWPAPKYNQFTVAWDALIAERDAGRARSIGVSNFTVEDLMTLREHSDVVPAVNQIELHPSLAQNELRALHEKLGIVTEAWSPLGQAKELDNPIVQEIAASTTLTPAQVVLAWHLHHGIVCIPKSVTPSRIEENFATAGIRLTKSDIDRLDTLDAGNRIGPDPTTTEF
ncbi:long-chain fatty acid--CoA ligase [Platysternon megacephalum]|uniref:Long-chain fatty acid--CoA ligase n=1 Tax=Platysternon megacephalum TaxID=55544 RepID=A0A4D9DES8_9SAUR|nr:long-chain fatty acid--CoA ligase [Platysternon megacephalum]